MRGGETMKSNSIQQKKLIEKTGKVCFPNIKKYKQGFSPDPPWGTLPCLIVRRGSFSIFSIFYLKFPFFQFPISHFIVFFTIFGKKKFSTKNQKSGAQGVHQICKGKFPDFSLTFPWPNALFPWLCPHRFFDEIPFFPDFVHTGFWRDIVKIM